ncbi:glycosyltransferase family 2 protein [Halopelagius fulvigenes]|uniref:Glycosyltransferase n=1 Tax=Halopelagius fulvigenes TaxID=1198324 RepID=A0ABD5TXA4_9EURY
MTVSVVLPTCERAEVLDGAIESVLAQTHEDWELVVVDGGSDDRTPELVAGYDDPRVRYRRQDDSSGVSAARNRGVAASDGEFVAFVDSDDRWHPEKLEWQLAALREAEGEEGKDAAVAYCGMEKAHGEPLTRDGESGDVREAVRRMDVPTYTSTLLVRRDAFESVGGFDERLPCFEDWELCLRLSREYRFVAVDDALVVKGESGDNISADGDNLAEAVSVLAEEYELPAATWAQLLADVGRTYCESGRLDAGRPYLRQALRLDPTRYHAAAALLFSAPGSPRAFDAAMEAVYAVERRAEAVGE